MAIQHRKVEIRVRLKHPVTETTEGELYGLRQRDTDRALSDAAESQTEIRLESPTTISFTKGGPKTRI